jgi:hypothetical protein
MANGIKAQPILGGGNRMVVLYHSQVRCRRIIVFDN